MTTTPPAKKHARDMTEAEFAEANRRHAWRAAPVTKSAAKTASGNSHAAHRGAAGSTTTTPAAPKHARDMTCDEFRAANAARAWRTPR